MKKTIYILVVAGFTCLVFSAFILNYASAFPAACGGVSEHNINKQSIDDSSRLATRRINPSPGAAFPEEVDKILKASCYGCHSDESSNKRAPLVLNFEKWDEYKVTKKISRLNDIYKMVDENKMPPARFLERNPDKALSDQQRKLICDWTAKESEKLMEGTDE